MEKSRDSREDQRKEKLNFKPLSGGLGFHPFSDGLPYAPIAKTFTGTQRASTTPAPVTTPFGSGAISAGPASFGPLPTRPTPTRISVPVAPTKVMSPEPTQTHVQALHQEESFGLGYLFKRVFAICMDTVVNLGMCGLTLVLALWKQGLSPDNLINPGVLVPFCLFLLAFNWAIITAQEVAFGTTVGKRMMGLALQGSASAIFLRSFFFLPSLGFCALGLIWAVFDQRRRCWHDIVVDLQPTHFTRL